MTWDVLPPGTWLIFGVVLLPVYVALLGWFLGRPRDVKVSLMGVAYLIGLTLALWIPFYLATVLIWLLFFRTAL